MAQNDWLLDELVAGYRILAREGVVDAMGHLSVRHPEQPDHFWISGSRAPLLVKREDIMTCGPDGEPIDANGRQPYIERFIHAALFESRPDVNAVIHNHTHSVIPFGITGEPVRPVLHDAGVLGTDIPLWDSRINFGDTDLLVSTMAMGRDLAKCVGGGTAALMRGHGCVIAISSIRMAVFAAVYLEVNAHLQMQAMQFGREITFLSPGEVAQRQKRINPSHLGGLDRTWEYWCNRAGVPFVPARDLPIAKTSA